MHTHTQNTLHIHTACVCTHTHTSTKLSKPARTRCGKRDLWIRAGWNITLHGNRLIRRSFNIGYCDGYCNNIGGWKLTERTALLDAAKRGGFLAPGKYREHCVPHRLQVMQVFVYKQIEKEYELFEVENLMVQSCQCVA